MKTMKKTAKRIFVYACVFFTFIVVGTAGLTAFVVSQLNTSHTIVKTCRVDGTHCKTITPTTQK